MEGRNGTKYLIAVLIVLCALTVATAEPGTNLTITTLTRNGTAVVDGKLYNNSGAGTVTTIIPAGTHTVTVQDSDPANLQQKYNYTITVVTTIGQTTKIGPENYTSRLEIVTLTPEGTATIDGRWYPPQPFQGGLPGGPPTIYATIPAGTHTITVKDTDPQQKYNYTITATTKIGQTTRIQPQNYSTILQITTLTLEGGAYIDKRWYPPRGTLPGGNPKTIYGIIPAGTHAVIVVDNDTSNLQNRYNYTITVVTTIGQTTKIGPENYTSRLDIQTMTVQGMAFIDGRRYQRFDILPGGPGYVILNATIPVGTHRITVRDRDPYIMMIGEEQDYNITLTTRAGQYIMLRPQNYSGKINVTTLTNEGIVRIDGKQYPINSLRNVIVTLPAGTHTVVVLDKGYSPVMITVALKVGQTLDLSPGNKYLMTTTTSTIKSVNAQAAAPTGAFYRFSRLPSSAVLIGVAVLVLAAVFIYVRGKPNVRE